MKQWQKKCSTFIQLLKKFYLYSLHTIFILLLLHLFLGRFALAEDNNEGMLKALNHTIYVQSRALSTYFPNVEKVFRVLKQEMWNNEVMIEEDVTILKRMNPSSNSWIETEAYATHWNIESAGLYALPSNGSNKNYLTKYALKYIDKRLSYAVKRAQKDSTLAKVGRVQKALKPQTKVCVAKNIKLRFKARVLQGKAIMQIENPYVDCHANIRADGKSYLYLKKDIKQLGVSTRMDYKINEGLWIASVDKRLTNEVTARFSFSQYTSTMALDDRSCKKVELIYASSF